MEKKEKLEKLNSMNKNTLMETLSIEYTNITDDFLEAKMPVNSKVHQPYGVLHGGASVVLAETVGSVLSAISVDTNKYKAFGLQITANHLKSMSEGTLTAKASFIKKGRTTHLINIKLYNQNDDLICNCSLTNIILEK